MVVFFPILDIFDRMENGPRMSERDFDLARLHPTLQRLLKEHDIHYDPTRIVPNDDSLIRDVFHAGFELACAVGLWCLDTKKVITFDENEVRTALKRVPDEDIVGEGMDKAVYYPRKIEDPRPPIVAAGCAGKPVTEEMFQKIYQSQAQNPLTSMLAVGCLTTIDGRDIKPNSPLELHACLREAMGTREVFRRVGRPGMPVYAGPNTAVSAIGSIGSMNAVWAQRPTDYCLTPLLNEMKTDYDRMVRVVYCLNNDIHIQSLQDPPVGGMAGGPEGVAVVGVASRILGAMVYQATNTVWHPFALQHRGGATTPKNILWTENVTGQALAKYTKLITSGNVFTVASPGTDTMLYETAANVVGMVPSGLHAGPGCGGATEPDESSGLEAKLLGEVAYASYRLNRDNADEIAKKINAKYENTIKKLEGGVKGKKFQECYDVKTLKPKKEWLDTYNRVKKELEDIGLDFKYAFEAEDKKLKKME
jgi:methylamine--corrinoid protein Co-methyltransferase